MWLEKGSAKLHFGAVSYIFIGIIIIFLRPLAQSRRLKIKQLQLDMALTQI